MDTRIYLGQLKNLDNRIKDLIKESERWHNIAISTGGIDYSEDKVQTSPNYDKIGNAVSMAVDYQRKCELQAKEYTQLRRDIIEQIKGINGTTEENGELYYNLLYGHYVDGKSFSNLVVDENYSYRQIKRYFNSALKEFERIYGELYLDAKVAENA